MKTNDIISQFRIKIFDYSEISVSNVFFFGRFGKIESDIIAVSKTGYLIEYEVKISRSDFLADRRKGKWKEYATHYNTAPKSFYYVVPEGIVKKEELPFFAGLIEFRENEGKYIFTTIVKPKTLNRLKTTKEQKYSLLKKLYYKSLNISFDYQNLIK